VADHHLPLGHEETFGAGPPAASLRARFATADVLDPPSGGGVGEPEVVRHPEVGGVVDRLDDEAREV